MFYKVNRDTIMANKEGLNSLYVSQENYDRPQEGFDQLDDEYLSPIMEPTDLLRRKSNVNTTINIDDDAKQNDVEISRDYKKDIKEPSQQQDYEDYFQQLSQWEQQNEKEVPSEMCQTNSHQVRNLSNEQQEYQDEFQELSQSEQQNEKEVPLEMCQTISLQENRNLQVQIQSNEQTMTDGIQYIFPLESQYNGSKIILMKGADLKSLESILQQYEIIGKYESGELYIFLLKTQYNGSKIILMIADLKSLESFLQQYEIICKYESGVQYIFLLKCQYNGSKMIQMRADLKSSESIVQQYEIIGKYKYGVEYIFILKRQYNGSKIIQKRADFESLESLESILQQNEIIGKYKYGVEYIFLLKRQYRGSKIIQIRADSESLKSLESIHQQNEIIGKCKSGGNTQQNGYKNVGEMVLKEINITDHSQLKLYVCEYDIKYKQNKDQKREKKKQKQKHKENIEKEKIQINHGKKFLQDIATENPQFLTNFLEEKAFQQLKNSSLLFRKTYNGKGGKPSQKQCEQYLPLFYYLKQYCSNKLSQGIKKVKIE